MVAQAVLWAFPFLSNGAPTLPPSIVASFTTFTFGPETVTFGNGLSTLFTVQPSLSAVPGYGLFYLGLTSSTFGLWSWANGPDYSLPTAYDYFGPSNQIIPISLSSPPFPPNISFNMEVRGNPVLGSTVPEPASLPLLATGAAFVLWFLHKRRKRSFI